MNDNPFYRLAPFIQEYIYSHNWTELRSIQVEACRVIFETDNHLLLTAQTASGKTEAAFLPILTLLHENPGDSVGVLYIGPIKALINDQFYRLNDLLKEARIPVWHWHGDVSQSEKQKLLKHPEGILQITPESLESLLINKATQLAKLFGDLRFVVIDEVHAFMGSDRGRQILCHLARLSRYMKNQPRRVGLSATLGDHSLAEQWLQSGTSRSVSTPTAESGQRKIRLSLEHFYRMSVPDIEKTPIEKDTNSQSEDDLISEADRYSEYIYQQTAGKKCLIFANSRQDTEKITASLRQLAIANNSPDIYHVHHGSISAPLREAAEEAMRDPYKPAVVAATVTLELGIDIGQLERIVQLSAPYSVASFLQRLGRSGRRGGAAEMWFVCDEAPLSDKDLLPDQIPWQLIQAIAIIQLYLEEQWVEPIAQIKYPFSLLYHQTMSVLSTGELSPAVLAAQVLTLPVFEKITQADYKELLLHLIKLDHIQQTEERGLIIGLEGEKIVRNFRFYAVFPDSEEYAVKVDSFSIGSVVMPPPVGERFALAGRTWQVEEIDLNRKVVFVRQVRGKSQNSWNGAGGNIHTKILRRMRQVLMEDESYPYLQKRATERIAEARRLCRYNRLSYCNIFSLGGNSHTLLPWLGTTGYRTLERVLKFLCKEAVGIKSVRGYPPYFITLEMSGSPEDLRREMASWCAQGIIGEALLDKDEAPRLQKYDEFIPDKLLRKTFTADHLNLAELTRLANELRAD